MVSPIIGCSIMYFILSLAVTWFPVSLFTYVSVSIPGYDLDFALGMHIWKRICCRNESRNELKIWFESMPLLANLFCRCINVMSFIALFCMLVWLFSLWFLFVRPVCHSWSDFIFLNLKLLKLQRFSVQSLHWHCCWVNNYIATWWFSPGSLCVCLCLCLCSVCVRACACVCLFV